MPPKYTGGFRRDHLTGNSRRDGKPASNGARKEGPRSTKAKSSLHLKKEKTKYHQDKFKRDRSQHGSTQRSVKNNTSLPAHRRQGGSHRTSTIDIHVAAKVSKELRDDIAQFKARRGSTDVFSKNLNSVLALVPPSFIHQHLPGDIVSFKTYLPKFERGAACMADAFISWHEWAFYELNKGKNFQKPDKQKEEDAEEVEKKESKKGSQTRQLLAHTLKEREHVKALLQMCLRHNATRRKEGCHAFINHINSKLAEDEVSCRTLEHLRGTAHHSIAYVLSRLVLGMATEDFAMIALHCQLVFLVLEKTPITASVILSLMDEELALDARMKAVRLRLDAKRLQDQAAPEEADDAVDPDDINDPTKGERNQRMTAAVFALAAIVASNAKMNAEDSRRLSTFLSFCYVEQKATRVLSANVLFMHLKRNDELFKDSEAMQWVSFAFFFYPKMEYYRPEGVQLLLQLMRAEEKPVVNCFPDLVVECMNKDPLDPATLEQIVNALFRKEQVTAVYPMVHPIWNDLFDIVMERVAAGESMKEHLSTIVHTVIAPYRRGSADVPRRALFQSLVTRLGQIAVQSEDAEQRAEMLHMASRNAGYGKRTTAQPTPLAELKHMPISHLGNKVDDLLQQYRTTRDADPAAITNRSWVLKELRNCLYLPVRSHVESTYVNAACRALLEFGFFPTGNSKDEHSKNRCIFLFAEVFSFTYNGSLARPKSTLTGLHVIGKYLSAEERDRTRYTTAVKDAKFRKARNRIVEALEKKDERSVLFYEDRDMEILLTLLFLTLSVDDASNADAVSVATSVVPDLVQFYLTGSLETLDILFDVLMSLIMRNSAPMHVMPLMTCVRRIVTGFVLKYAPYIRDKFTLETLLIPLQNAYNTNSREIARQKKAGGDDDSDEDEDAKADEPTEETPYAEEGDSDTDAEEASNSSDSDEDTEVDSAEDSDNDENDGEHDGTEVADTATESDRSQGSLEDSEDSDGEDANEGEAPTQAFIDALKGMVGSADLDHVYPTDAASKEKNNIVRVIHLVGRVGTAMRSPLVIHIFQVLLAVCRETVKGTDDVIFNAAVASLEMLLMTKNRHYGFFLPATDLFQLLGDIQSYSRKLERSLFSKENVSARIAAMGLRRLGKVKGMALRVFHFVSMLAYKNHAGEEARITFTEYYKSIFCDRGWDMKRVLPGLKKDLFHYRQGFAWALLPAVFEKFEEVVSVDGPQRVRVFTGTCTMVEAMLSRLSRLPAELKESSAASIRKFVQSVSLEQVYRMKHTLPHTYLHMVKMVLQYNSRVSLDAEWVSMAVVNEAVDRDDIQLSGASVRTLTAIERLLNMTPRARETKAPVPVKVLYQQFEKVGAKEKGEFYRKNKRVRSKVLKALLAHRNDEPTDQERAVKRRRREELKIEDRLQRQVVREAKTKVLTKEEREEKRKRIMMAKQERIAKNRERKRRLHEVRQKSFDRWRQTKLAAATALQVDDEDE